MKDWNPRKGEDDDVRTRRANIEKAFGLKPGSTRQKLRATYRDANLSNREAAFANVKPAAREQVDRHIQMHNSYLATAKAHEDRLKLEPGSKRSKVLAASYRSAAADEKARAASYGWDESKHPRDEQGRFI